MSEERWIGHLCGTCGLPLHKDDPQEYSDYMMPIHREDYCVRYLKESCARLAEKLDREKMAKVISKHPSAKEYTLGIADALIKYITE